MGAYAKNFIDGVSDQKSLKTNDKMDLIQNSMD